MGGQLPFDYCRIGRLLGSEVGIQGNLGVDGQVRAIGKTDADVGAHPDTFAVHAR